MGVQVKTKSSNDPKVQKIEMLMRFKLMPLLAIVSMAATAQHQDNEQQPQFFSGDSSVQATEPRSDYGPGNGRQMSPMQEDREIQLVSYYISHLRRQLERSDNQLAEGLNIDQSQLSEIRQLIAAVDEAEAVLTTQRVNAMCAEWNRLLVSHSEEESARMALELSKELEVTQRSRNSVRAGFAEAMMEIVGSQNQQRLEQHMVEFAGAAVGMQSYSWSDMVLSVGMIEEQLRYTCGE